MLMPRRAGVGLLLLLLPALSLAVPARDAKFQVGLEVALDTPVVLAGGARRAFLRVALTGSELGSGARTPVNLALVLDRSGSMSGRKLEEAKRAAVMAIDRLGANDIVSVVAYDDTVDVLAPARRLSDAGDIRSVILGLGPGGSTALFAGVSKGAREVRRFLAPDRVNRVILLSDGLANVGPSSPGELAELGASLARESIAVTTVGLGLDYNEELMTRLAGASDGNHFFAERAEDLARIYETELGEVLSVIAQDVDVTIQFDPRVRPLRVLGREATVRGRTVVGRLNQLYARQTKYFVVEVELPAGERGETLALAQVTASYANMSTHAKEQLTQQVSCRFSSRQVEVDAAQNPRVVGSVARQIGAEHNREAMELRDQGQLEAARKLLLDNAAYLKKVAETTQNRHLAGDAQQNLDAASNLDPSRWNRQRKQMQKEQLEQLRSLGYVQ